MKTLNAEHQAELLKLLGFEPQRQSGDHWLETLGVFAAGLAVGAGVALLLAPSSGRELRAELKNRLPNLTPPPEQPAHSDPG